MYGIDVVRTTGGGPVERSTCPANELQRAIEAGGQLLDKVQRGHPEWGADGFIIRDAAGGAELYRSWEPTNEPFEQQSDGLPRGLGNSIKKKQGRHGAAGRRGPSNPTGRF